MGKQASKAVKEGERGGGDGGIWENMKITFNVKRQRQRVKHFFTFPRCHQIGLADSRVKPSSRDRRRETERWTDRETDRPKRLADRATEREDRRSILFCFMPLYSVLCLHKSEVRQIALECVNQRSWAGTRTSTRTRTDSCGSGAGGRGGVGCLVRARFKSTSAGNFALRWLFLRCRHCRRRSRCRCWSGFWQNRLYWFHAGKIKKWTCGNLHT